MDGSGANDVVGGDSVGDAAVVDLSAASAIPVVVDLLVVTVTVAAAAVVEDCQKREKLTK